ncbi:thiamine pyrophosphate-binding protein, partial [Streptomyces lydicus]
MTAMADEIPEDGGVRVVDYLAAELTRVGVTHMFGVGGANIEDLYDAVHRTGTIRGVVAKHEFSAVTMADGYARATRRLGPVVWIIGRTRGRCLRCGVRPGRWLRSSRS